MMWGTPLHPRRKKTPSQATVGFSENEVSILFCYWAACVCLSMAGGQETHKHNKQRYLINSKYSKWESRMEVASVRWWRNCQERYSSVQNFSARMAEPEPYFCQPSMRILAIVFFSVRLRDHLLSHMRTDERSQICPIPNYPHRIQGYFFISFRDMWDSTCHGKRVRTSQNGRGSKLRGALKSIG